MSFRILWSLLAALSLALPAGAQLTERQAKALDGIARERYSTRWTELGTNELATLRKRADGYIDNLRDRHLVGGLVASVRYTDKDRTSVVRYEALEDSAAWTGLLLAAHAYRFAVTRDDRSVVGDDPSLPAIRDLLTGVETLLRATGRPGYLPRFVGRAADPAYAKFYATYGGEDPARPGFGRLAFQGTGTNSGVVWLGGPSRDQYAALNLGFAAVWQFVRNDPKIRERVTAAAVQVVERLQADKWLLDDGRGNVTFVTPALAAAVLRTGAAVRPDRYAALYDQKTRAFLELPATGLVRYGDSRLGAFTAVNLLALSRMETTESRRLIYQELLTKLWRDSGPQLNPLVAACYMSAFNSTPNDFTAQATLQGVLSQYPDAPRWSAAHDVSGDATVPKIEVGGVKWTQFAQPLDRRPVAPFQWVRSSYQLGGGEDAPVAHPGVDYLLAFWMAREASVIPNEDFAPASKPDPGARRRSPGTNAPVSPPKTAPGAGSGGNYRPKP
jgi:hypothetical protein